jgi:drug/metabolite transporter (DMT)-like permease
VLRIHITKSAGSLFMSLTTYQIPIWAIVYSVTFSNEELPPTLFIGLLIILLGIGISQSRAIIGFLKK